MAAVTNVSNDLVWLLTRNSNSFLVKGRGADRPQLSRDPLNLQNQHSYKYAGYANSKAIGVQGTENGGVTVTTKKTSAPQQPAKTFVNVNYGPKTSTRKIYKGVADVTAKNNYRGDIREDAVTRVSAIRRSQKPKKETPARKPRGAQAKKAAAEKSE
ncbi:60S ribosomal protein L28 [Aspergillus chevalieri]|uniref:Ribosomal eL28/Mak16 domain-containing protein n=1 Tax=Aspergillus chevalieri TaxID=182096 RepID=A0A7R7VQP3_ASPCH|nr:uncharacterized protein ACHE_50263S [Aspergillus chevalieri]BCR89065.1 hypothetical protein ACHE_50263S [Aspergillus chevalieri]